MEVEDAAELWTKYDQAFPVQDDGQRKRKLVDFLALEGNLKAHFKTRYYSLENSGAGIVPTPLDPNEGRKTLRSLLRVDFVDAQRNIDDENATRSNKLSEAFAAYYQRNLEQAEAAEEAVAVIEENNQNLTAHYHQHFQPLMGIIADLGLPSHNDRAMKIVSTLSSEVALRGSAELFYVDAASSHELPEAYNGLGFKNLVFMAIQIDNFYKQWLATDENRPLCQMIFVEEPEVHLHAQVQQTFIKQIWKVLTQGAGDAEPRPQLTVTTHSSHVLDAVDFSKIRYFRRVDLDDEATGNTYPGSIVKSLKEFQPDAINVGDLEVSVDEALAFLKKYLRLTHCDLFFADAAILVEGAVEKLLLPKMIDLAAGGLNTKYITILEVGGAYSMRFAKLLEFLGIPYLVITDIDSVDPNNNRKGCKATDAGAVTSNASIKYFFDGSDLEIGRAHV
uniref:ATP-dependent nuclease n=2 Tax=Hyphomonas atlantica TaxID=1280948 RepID=UPI00355A820A